MVWKPLLVTLLGYLATEVCGLNLAASMNTTTKVSMNSTSRVSMNSTEGAGVFRPTAVQLGEVKFELSQNCLDQRAEQGKASQIPGKNYTFRIQGLQPQEVRIAFAGDSVVQGCCGTDFELWSKLPLDYKLTDQFDGTQSGLQGFEYLLHELFRVHNSTTKYTFMNYGIMGGAIMKGPHFQSYHKDCRGEQFLKSMPHVVVLGFGGMDTIQQDFTVEKFKQDYLEYIDKVKKIPTKPLIMMMTPVFTCHFSDIEEDKGHNHTLKHQCKSHQNHDLTHVIYEIAQASGIPEHHIVDAWQLLRLNPRVKAEDVLSKDGMHPNHKGFGIIAQEFYMKMSLSPEFMARQKMAVFGEDPDFNGAVKNFLNL